MSIDIPRADLDPVLLAAEHGEVLKKIGSMASVPTLYGADGLIGYRVEDLLAALINLPPRETLWVKPEQGESRDPTYTLLGGNVAYNPGTFELSVDGLTVGLAPREAALFDLLAQNEGAFLQSTALRKIVWEGADQEYPSINTRNAALRKQILVLRKNLGQYRDHLVTRRDGKAYGLFEKIPINDARGINRFGIKR